jgi:hypothetical protein
MPILNIAVWMNGLLYIKMHVISNITDYYRILQHYSTDKLHCQLYIQYSMAEKASILLMIETAEKENKWLRRL